MNRRRCCLGLPGVVVVLAVLLLAGSVAPLSAQGLATFDIELAEPSGRQAVFGVLDVEVTVHGTDELAEMVLEVDGRVRGRLDGPPWVFRVDVGQENREHVFRVVARRVDGEEAGASVTTPAVRIDDEVAVELQQLYVTATSRDGARILDLEEGDFRIFDEGQRQELVTFARGDVPITAALLIDSSESMRGERLQAAIAGTRAFVEGMRELDEAAVLSFSDQLLGSTAFTREKDRLLGALEGMVARGNTSINDHLYLALKLLESRQGRRVVVLFTDGADLHSVLEMEEVVWKARRSRALIYWIRLDEGGHRYTSFATAWRNAEGNRREIELLEKAVAESGGRVATLDSIDGVEGAFRDILAELREQYVLGYYPSEVRNDGSWHGVRVEVGRSGVRLRAREGYVD